MADTPWHQRWGGSDAASLGDYLKAWPTYLLPHHLLSRLMLAGTRVRLRAYKNWQINMVTRRFGVDLSEALEPDPDAYPDFNSFFTRALKPEARPVVSGTGDIACPVDGAVSQAGDIVDGEIIQAKGQRYSLETLLGGSAERAAPFVGGRFATLYLSPRDYHRIHMPLDGTLREMVHVPGRLFSVSPSTTRVVPNLFARNERVITLFDTAAGPMALVLVGAIFVGSVETLWHGVITPPRGKRLQHWQYNTSADEAAVSLARGAEMGRFNMGSTVIVLFGRDRVDWAPEIQPDATVRMGQLLATGH